MPITLEMPMIARTCGLAVSLALALAGPAPVAASPPAAAAPARDPAAEAAHAAALALMARGEWTAAIAELDLAVELEPTWSDPVRARAEAFGALADRYHPSAAFMASRRADLQRLLALEPGVDVAARQREIAALGRQSREAHALEQRRRKLSPLAIVAITVSGALVISGAMLYGMKPNEFLKPTAYRYEHRDAAGLGMLIAGVLLAPPAIALGVLAGRQARRDAAVRELDVQTGRPRATLGVTPRLAPDGGGLGFSLRF